MGKVQIEKSRDNYNVVKLVKDNRNFYIGSKYCQKREIDKFIESLCDLTEKDNYIVFGAGSLEHIKVLVEKKDENAKILVVEVDEEILNEISKLDDYKELVSRDDIVITNNIEDIMEFMVSNIEDLNVEFAKISTFSNYNKIYNTELVEVYKMIKKHIVDMFLEKNTRIQFKDDWVNSNLQNAKYICESMKVNNLKDKFRNIPAIIVSAGPSLEKNIKDINKDKAYIISGGRTLKPLLECGIDPDFMAVIDGSKASYDLVGGYLDKTNTNLIYNEMTSSRILDEFKGKKIVGAQGGFIKDILGEDILDIIKGGSVANTMTYVAGYMGFNPIIFIGQDLAYTNNKEHAECAKSKASLELDENNYGSPYVKGIYGGEVKTSESLKSFKEALENIITMFKDTKFINATEGGAFIEGTEVMTLKECLSDFKILKKDDDIVVNELNEEILEKTIKGIKENIKAARNIIKLTKEGIIKFRNFKTAYIKNDFNAVNKYNKELDYIESKLNNNIKKFDIANSRVYSICYELETCDEFVIKADDSKEKITDKKMNLNIAIYLKMQELCEEYLNKMQDTLVNMEKMYGRSN